MQYRAGRYFVLEHPAGSQIWLIKEIADLLRMNGVGFTAVDMCQYGLFSTDRYGTDPAMKPTTLVTNSPVVIANMTKKVQWWPSTCAP